MSAPGLPSAAAAPLLEARDITKRYGGFTAVSRCSLQVRGGTVTGLIGPNGAGKSTLFSVLSGFAPPEQGRVWFAGRDVTGWPPHRVARAGLVRTFQVPRLFERMSVWENLMVAGRNHPGERLAASILGSSAARRREQALAARAAEVLGLLRLEPLRDRPAAHLSGGQRKLLELGRALMLEPRLLLLDEPFAGVSPALAAELSERIRELHRAGHTFLIIEHKIDLLMALAQEVWVMAAGQMLTHGPPGAVRGDPRVVEAYLGRSWAPAASAIGSR